jgi:uncharacterized protein
MPGPPDRFSPRQRWLSLAEFALGAGIVIGHNVFHIVPNEVPILFVLGWISLRWRDGGWQAVGLVRPASWWRTALIALAAAVLMQLASEYVSDPIAHRLFRRPPNLSEFKPLVGNWKAALAGLGVIWTFAAFGEEMSYRGYLLTRAADVGARSKAAYWCALAGVMILFGYGHYYQGPAGVLSATFSGLILGGAYLLGGRNLWVPILAHGISDTFAVVVVFAGLADNV